MVVKNFCFFFDLRRGCVIYAWLQMMFITVIVTKIKMFLDLIFYQYANIGYMFSELSIFVGVIAAIQLLKGAFDIALIWGAVKKLHLFYQPWLFINALENIIMLITAVLLIVAGSHERHFMNFLAPFIILPAFGCYIWICVFSLYRNDRTPGIIVFNANYDNLQNNV